MMLTLQVVASALLVLAVLWFMWRLPHRGEALQGWGPPLALASPWLGLLAVVMNLLLWWLPYPDRWLVLVFLLLDPAAIATGALVLWLHRGQNVAETDAVAMRRLQARVGVALGLLAVMIGYIYVMTHKAPGTIIGA